ncbi:heavy-metal-associated domain-containing protein [Halopenitus salinus]|jgi:copper chaperone|uniref:Heavy-metal-associated domain-containing protein n=1 Tax=Halopenitus salinus TaxID=1198295 RepID=A0ABD5V000_9EURY
MVELNVDGMACDGCETAVVEALSEVPGVEEASADHERGIATVSVAGGTDREVLAAAVEEAGYEVVDD